MFVAMLAYRTHFASIFDYHTNHLPLPWSGSHESLNPRVPEPNGSNVSTQMLKGRNNFAATAWPRKPKTYSFGNNGQQMGRVSGVPGLDGTDGTADGAPLARLDAKSNTARRPYSVVRRAKGRTRLALFPRAGDIRHGSLRGSGVVQPGCRGRFEMTPAVGPEGVVNEMAAGRMGVDDWVRHTRRGRTGRPSEMV